MKKVLSFVLALAMLLSLTACGKEKSVSKTVYAMDTVMNLTVYRAENEAALNEAEELLYSLDALFDRHCSDSAVSALNRDGFTEDVSLVQLLADAVYLSALTDGAFDPTLAPVLDAWGFGTEAPRVPTEEELRSLLEKTGAEHISFSDGLTSASLSGGIAVDLGGIAKGYAGDCVKEIFENYGCAGVIDLGGDVALVGQKDGQPWRIAVKDPADTDSFLGVLEATDVFVVTSGIYERYFEENGVRYHHIIDPATGRSARSGLVSVTVVCGSGVCADAFSTALFVMGAENALDFYRDAAGTANAFEMILVTEDGTVQYTSGLSDCFTPSEDAGYTYECIA